MCLVADRSRPPVPSECLRRGGVHGADILVKKIESWGCSAPSRGDTHLRCVEAHRARDNRVARCVERLVVQLGLDR
jgi:hypothetical protein